MLGTLLAAMPGQPRPAAAGLATFYVEMFRNTPLTVVFFFIDLRLPQIDFRGRLLHRRGPRRRPVHRGLRLRGHPVGHQRRPPGQAEAARSIGLTFGQSLREVVLPQAFRTVVPPLGNVFIAMVKNTSIAAGFAVTELTASCPGWPTPTPATCSLFLVGVVAGYMLITLPSAFAVHRLERRVAILR